MDLDQALDNHERTMVQGSTHEPAIDYIICDPATKEHYWEHKETKELVHNY